MNPLANNAEALDKEIAWFERVLDLRLQIHVGQHEPVEVLDELPPPELDASGPFAELVREHELGPSERLVLILACLPELRPAILDPLLLHNASLGRRFTEFGGAEAESSGFLPTAATVLFLLAGDSLAGRLRHQRLIDDEHRLYQRGLLRLERRTSDGLALAAVLRVTPEARVRLTTGETYNPPFSAEFPAQRLTTELDWRDLVIDERTRDELDDIIRWARHQRRILDHWRLRSRLAPGFRALFYGPPGTGKTMTAGLIGKQLDVPVYRVDLSQVISKYIGETEKNIASLFDRAREREWVLFFDEADALFGQRGEAQTANDRAANQQIAYLLQRFEQFSGIAILATNLEANIDEAFTRRFQAKVAFKLPDRAQRLQLWRNNFEGQAFALAPDVDLGALAREYELSGGQIVNVLRFACLRAVEREPAQIDHWDLLRGIQRELDKEGKSLRW